MIMYLIYVDKSSDKLDGIKLINPDKQNDVYKYLQDAAANISDC